MKNKEFQKFDKVMDALLSVPYKELQEKLEEEKERKAKEKKGRVKISARLPVSTDSRFEI